MTPYQKVFSAIRASNARLVDIATATRMTTDQVRSSMRHLCERGYIVCAGTGPGARWSIPKGKQSPPARHERKDKPLHPKIRVKRKPKPLPPIRVKFDRIAILLKCYRQYWLKQGGAMSDYTEIEAWLRDCSEQTGTPNNYELCADAIAAFRSEVKLLREDIDKLLAAKEKE